LQLHQKAVILGGDAAFMMNLVKDGVVYSLYSYFEFYVEVVIEKDSSRLVEVFAFTDEEVLEKYLDRIVLVGL